MYAEPLCPIRFPFVSDDVSGSSSPSFSSNTYHHTPSNPAYLRLGAVIASPLLIRRPTLLKPLNLRIQRSRGHLDHGGIRTEFLSKDWWHTAHRRKQNTQVRAFLPDMDLPFFFCVCVCVFVREWFAVYSWASNLYLGMMIFLPIR